MADRLGLCSVTLRALSPGVVLDVAAEAGLGCIEWGADVHAPPESSGLEQLGNDTTARGLRTCSYGSYWRAGSSPLDEFVVIAKAAQSLGAPRIRVWAGTTGSRDASRQVWHDVVGGAQRAADVAGEHGCGVAFEFHGGTLTDTAEGTARLLDQVDRPTVSTYWQPRLDASDDDAVADLEHLVDRVSAVHAFSWWPGTTRLPLAGREQLWRRVIELLAGRGSTADVLLEFVPDDDPALVSGEAAFLRSLCRDAPR